MFLPQLLHALLPFIPYIIVLSLSFFPTTVQAQFRFDNLLEGIGMEAAQKIINGDLGEQNDPLRRVFGIWGRLLNRMAQKDPPSDDELHLRGAQEGEREDGNVIGEDPEGLNFPPRGGGFGGGSAKSFGGGSVKPFGGETVDRTVAPAGPNKIIDEQRLNELLPRLNPNFAKEEKHFTTTTTTTEQKTTAQPTTTSTMMTTQMTKAMTENEQKLAKVKKTKRKKKVRQKSVEEQAGTERNRTTMPSSPTTPSTTLSIPTTTTENLPPNENDGIQTTGQNQHFTTKVGETIQLRTTADEKGKGQMEKIKEGELNETMWERTENETAQLIAEIENVLADAEMGPNGHWLSQQTMDQNMTMPRSGSSSVKTPVADNDIKMVTIETGEKTKTEEQQQKEEEASYEEDEEVERGEEESYERDDGEEAREEEMGEGKAGTTVKQNNKIMGDGTTAGRTTSDQQQLKGGGMTNETTQRTAAGITAAQPTTETAMAMSTSAMQQRWNGPKKWIPEAEEEDPQHQQHIAAQLQLDPAVTVSSSPSPATPQQSPQSAQNIFNLNANSNAYANPNLTNVMKPVNSIIDGIGPLILPLIGYSQRAFDAYAPLVAQRSTEGLPIFVPPAIAAAPLSQQREEAQPLMPIGSASSSVSAHPSAAAMSVPSALPPQLPHAQPLPPPTSSVSGAFPPPPPSASSAAVHAPHQTLSSEGTNQLELAREAPSLEMLGKIIEERRKNEQSQRRKGTGRADGGREISGSSPADAELAYFPPNLPVNGPPAHPFDQPILERPAEHKSDRGYDAGRQTVHDTFHEDSGLMLGTQQTQNEQQSHGTTPLPAANAAFGNGKRPAESFGFTRR